MEIKEYQVFNLWDTNGRRKDVLNAIQIYLGILNDLNRQRPCEIWGAYPGSLKQYLFYKEAIAASPEIFKDHEKFDLFNQQIGKYLYDFLAQRWNRSSDKEMNENLDKNVEARARHYTSNLVRLGFAFEDRRITPIGFDFLADHIKRDAFESVLPISDISVVLLRQLMKLKIYGEPDQNGLRRFYAPFFMALYLMLQNDSVDKDVFKCVVQGVSPYWCESNNPDEILKNIRGSKNILRKTRPIPLEFQQSEKLDKSIFDRYVKNRKSGNTVDIYYAFYTALYEFVKNQTDLNYLKLRKIIVEENGEKLVTYIFFRKFL